MGGGEREEWSRGDGGGGDVWLNDLLYLWLAYRWLRVGNVYRSSGHATVAVVVV